ncbi:MAG: carboxypeptidase-like regulatory domain-containing protein [Gemmatimonadota bacterium]
MTILALIAIAIPRVAAAQELRGTIIDSTSRRPVAGAVVMLMDSVRMMLGRGLSDERGEYRLLLTAAATRIRIVRLGFRAREVSLPADHATGGRVDVVMLAIPAMLDRVAVIASPKCAKRSDAEAALALLDQARSGLLATIVAREANPGTFKMLAFGRSMDGYSDRILKQAVRIDSSSATKSFYAVRTGADFVRLGFARDSNGVRNYLGPDAETLIDNDFALGYCFRVHDPVRERPHQVGLTFGAADRKKGRIDVDGTLWVDTAARALRDIEFSFVGTEPLLGAPTPGGHIWFREMPSGVVIIDRWFFRLIGAGSDTSYSHRSDQSIRTWYFARDAGGEVARVIWPDGRAWKASLGTLELHLVDRLGRPARNQIIRLRDTDYLASPNARGDLEIPDLLPGPYVVQAIDVESGVALDTDLSIVAIRDSVVRTALVAPAPDVFRKKACERTAPNRWIPVLVLIGQKAPAPGVEWEIGTRLGTEAEDVIASGHADEEGRFGFCSSLMKDRILDVRTRRNEATRQDIITSLVGTVNELKITLPPSP